MNFGQHWRTPNVETLAYSVTLPNQFFRDMLAVVVPAYLEDSRQFPDNNDPFENALRQNDWPDAQAICDTPELARMALEWCAHDLLLAWLGDGEPIDAPGYVINSIDSFDFVDSNPRITGTARAAGIPVQYQDV